MGSLLICVVVPTILFGLRDASEIARGDGAIILLIITVPIFVGPGLLILARVLLGTLRRKCDSGIKDEGLHRLLVNGAISGALLAFLNFPGYVGYLHLARDPHPILRLAVIFIVTGALCGVWIAWQAFKERNPDRGFIPSMGVWALVSSMIVLFTLLWFFLPLQR